VTIGSEPEPGGAAAAAAWLGCGSELGGGASLGLAPALPHMEAREPPLALACGGWGWLGRLEGGWRVVRWLVGVV
jgi:hypothetical protein